MLKFAGGTCTLFVCIILSCFLLNPAVLRAAEAPAQGCEARLIKPVAKFMAIMMSGLKYDVIPRRVAFKFATSSDWKNPFANNSHLLGPRLEEMFEDLSRGLSIEDMALCKSALRDFLEVKGLDDAISAEAREVTRRVFVPKQLMTIADPKYWIEEDGLYQIEIEGRPVFIKPYSTHNNSFLRIVDPFNPQKKMVKVKLPQKWDSSAEPLLAEENGTSYFVYPDEKIAVDLLAGKMASRNFKAAQYARFTNRPRLQMRHSQTGLPIDTTLRKNIGKIEFSELDGETFPALDVEKYGRLRDISPVLFRHSGKILVVVALAQKGARFANSFLVADVRTGEKVNFIETDFKIPDRFEITLESRLPVVYFRAGEALGLVSLLSGKVSRIADIDLNSTKVGHATFGHQEFMLWADDRNGLTFYDVEADSRISIPADFTHLKYAYTFTYKGETYLLASSDDAPVHIFKLGSD